MGILQNFDWEKFIWALAFGGLGYLARTFLNLISGQAEKRLEFGLDVRKDQEKARLENALLASQACSDLQDVIVRLFDLIRHSRVKDRETYTKSILLETITLLMGRLEIIKSLNISLILHEREPERQLKLLIHDIEQYFSNQGFLRKYQQELAEFTATSETARLSRSMVSYRVISTFPSTAPFEILSKCCDTILKDFQFRSSDETRFFLKERLPRILDPGGTLCRQPLSEQTFEFLSLLQRLYDLLNELQGKLLRVYRL